MYRYPAKKNQDGSFSVSIPIGDLTTYGFVDYYNEQTGRGLQRYERSTPARGRKVTRYIRRTLNMGLRPHLFELTANVRTQDGVSASFESVSGKEDIGELILQFEGEAMPQAMSLVDGGTRFLGLRYALDDGLIGPEYSVDVRVFSGLSEAEEIAIFLLINLEQKKVRTDLSLRLIQRKLDHGELSDGERNLLHSAVPEQDSWKFDASRITSSLNADQDSPWQGLIQMPSDLETKPLKMQAMFTSLKPILTDADLTAGLRAIEESSDLAPGELLIKILKNFWSAIAEVNPDARNEPRTTVLWGSIGASACHIVLARLLGTELRSPRPNLTTKRFVEILRDTDLQDYDFWFTSASTGSRDPKDYPEEKGEATTYTGAAGYGRLADELEKSIRANAHALAEGATVLV